MTLDFIRSLLSDFWSIVLVILFFGGSILVHELGHFWAARRRGVLVERFSIGFGPKIVSWRGKDGVDYRLSWLPIGGYVALPQLAEMSAIEGESTADLTKVPPPDYTTRMVVFSAGAAMNVAFAFLLACIIWIIGQPTSSEMATTRIGYVAPTIELSTGTKIPSPAMQAGLQAGDIVRSIDGTEVREWYDLMHTLMTSAGRTAEGKPRTTFTVERQGRTFDVLLYPQLAGAEKDRRVGIAPAYELIVHSTAKDSIAAKIGLLAGDEILRLGDKSILHPNTFQETWDNAEKAPTQIVVRRKGQELAIDLPQRAAGKIPHGLAFTTGYRLMHPTPFAQLWDHTKMTFRTLWSLIHPHSDIGLSKVAGPVGIMRIFHHAAEAGLRSVLMFTILVNMSLAIFNLLPIPVLDGGHMLFATINRFRKKALPASWVMTTQGVFMILLLSMVFYVSFFDVRRLVRDVQADRAESKAQQQQQAPAKK